MSPDRVELRQNIGIEIPRDKRGRVRWKLPGNTPKQDEQLGIRNIQTLFLERFPEFNESFPRGADGSIALEKRQRAGEFILKRVGTLMEFREVFGASPLTHRGMPYFKRSFRLAIGKSFSCWGIDLPEQAPDSWMTTTSLRQQSLRIGFLKKRAREVDPNQTEWFKDYLDSGGHPRKHYSPDFIALITQESKQYEKSTKDWQTSKELARQTGRDKKTIAQLANRFKKDHAEWSGMYFDSAGNIREHYSPELVSLIMEANSPPERWKTTRVLVNRLGKSFETIRKLARRLNAVQEDQIKQYFDSNGIYQDHYSPELVNLITKEANQYHSPPDNWMTNNSLARLLQRDFAVIRRRALNYRTTHAEWFGTYCDSIGNLREHYAPELVAEITRTLEVKTASDSPISPEQANEQLRRLLEGNL